MFLLIKFCTFFWKYFQNQKKILKIFRLYYQVYNFLQFTLIQNNCSFQSNNVVIHIISKRKFINFSKIPDNLKAIFQMSIWNSNKFEDLRKLCCLTLVILISFFQNNEKNLSSLNFTSNFKLNFSEIVVITSIFRPASF